MATFNRPTEDPERFQRLCATIAAQQLKKAERHQEEAEKWLAWGRRVMDAEKDRLDLGLLNKGGNHGQGPES